MSEQFNPIRKHGINNVRTSTVKLMDPKVEEFWISPCKTAFALIIRCRKYFILLLQLPCEASSETSASGLKINYSPVYQQNVQQFPGRLCR